MRAEAAGDSGPWRQQAILGRGRWDADALRDIVRDYVIEHLGTDDAVLVIGETGFLKQGVVCQLHGIACRRATAPREPGFTTGPISNSPTLMLTNMPTVCPERGPGVC